MREQAAMSQRELLRQAAELLAATGVDRVGSPGLQEMDEFPQFRAPRHPRARPAQTLRIRVDIAHAKPPIWRRLELSSDLTLADIHDVLQAAFEWDNGHLHHFRYPGRGYESEYFVDPDQLDDGDGTDESTVLIGELMGKPGDKLHYEYDFGDGWEHHLRLEHAGPRGRDAPNAVCVAGRRRGPIEDSGGIWAYEQMCRALADPTHEDYERYCEWFGLGDGSEFDPSEFSVDEVDLDFEFLPR